MKKLFSFIILTFAFTFCSAQNKKPYISLYITNGGNALSWYKYEKNKNTYILQYTDYIDSSNNFNQQFTTDTLFNYINNNLKEIKYLHRELNSNSNRKVDFKTPNVIFKQIGIKYKSLHYNHFFPITASETILIKNNKLKKGQEVINNIESFFLNFHNY